MRALLLRGLPGLVIVALLLAPSAQGKTRTVDAYCSPTGDYCIAVLRSHGRIKFVLRTFSFRGAYKICVKPPRQRRECLNARLVGTRHGIYASRVDFARNFFHRARGRYTASWHYEGFRIGKRLHFRKR